jgi:P pilus assembly chaperone PapD
MRARILTRLLSLSITEMAVLSNPSLRAVRWSAGWVFFLCSVVCQAGGLSISPLRLEFDAARNIGTITVTNTSRDTVTFEVDAVPWPEDAQGQSVRDIVVNPPISTLAPGDRKTVRIGLVKRLGAEQERTYRVYVSELASPRANDATGIGVRLRLGIPVFVLADSPREPALTWTATREDKAIALTATNLGNVHQRISSLSVEKGDKQYTATQQSSYVLAGRSTSFRVEGLVAQTGEQVILLIKAGDNSIRVPVQIP